MTHKYSDDSEYTEEYIWSRIFSSGAGRFNKKFAVIYSALRLEEKEFGHISEAQNMLPCRILNCPRHPRFPYHSRYSSGYCRFISDFCQGCMMKMRQKPPCPNCSRQAEIHTSSIDGSCDPSDYYELVLRCDKCGYCGRLQTELTT